MNLRDQLIEFEGVVPHAYRDSRGLLTIGVGRLIDESHGGGLSPDEIAYLLDNDIRRHHDGVMDALPWARKLNAPRQAVLIGMSFQMGLRGLLTFKNTLRAVEEGRYADAARGMRSSLWAKQTPARAKRLATQMLTGSWS